MLVRARVLLLVRRPSEGLYSPLTPAAGKATLPPFPEAGKSCGCFSCSLR